LTDFFGTLAIGLGVFIATNVDDIIVLTLFFSQVKDGFRNRDIVIGQYLGFIVLITISLIGLLGSVALSKPWTGLLGLIPIALGIKKLFDWRSPSKDAESVIPEKNAGRSSVSQLRNILGAKTYVVAAVTFANGGDNIATYVPLFANSTVIQVGILIGIFLLMIAVWCYIGYRLVRQPSVNAVLTRFGSRIIPFVFIGLGVAILLESGIFALIFG
jgi:cadmium resistance transport/sequestration family protein